MHRTWDQNKIKYKISLENEENLLTEWKQKIKKLAVNVGAPTFSEIGGRQTGLRKVSRNAFKKTSEQFATDSQEYCF